MQRTVAPSALRSPSRLFWIRLSLTGFFRRSGISLLLARTWPRSSQLDRWVRRTVADGSRSLDLRRTAFIRSGCRSPSKPAAHAREIERPRLLPSPLPVAASFQLTSPRGPTFPTSLSCGCKFSTCLPRGRTFPTSLSPWPHVSNFPLPVAAPFQLPSLVGASFQLAHAFDKRKSCRRTADFNRWAGRRPGRHD